MAGLEKITGEIISAANEKSDAIIAEANETAKRLLSDAESQSQKETDALLSTAKQKAESIKSAADSACALDKKNKTLKAKMELINQAFDQAVKKLKSLDNKTYFSVIKKLCVSYAVKGVGTLTLSEKDLAAVPADFMQSLEKDLQSGKKITLCEKGDNRIDGGCIIKYEEIEINCTFDAIISSEKERLIDCVNSVLFC